MTSATVELIRRGYGPRGRLGSLEQATVSAADLEAEEHRLGFTLPPLLRELYTKVGNGGFGPDGGVLGLKGGVTDDDGRSLIDVYQWMLKANPIDPDWKWPEKMVPLLDLGCAIKLCVDCSEPPHPVVLFDPNGHSEGIAWDAAFSVASSSFEAWIAAWLKERGLETHES